MPPISRRSLLASALFASHRFRPAEEILEKAANSGQLKAAVLRIEQKGEVFERTFGAAKPDSPFLIASITKPMTASAVMLLADRGQLQYEDPITKYLDNPANRPAITIRQLLTHTSGLPDMLPNNIDLRQRQAHMQEFIQGALTTPLLFQPGAKTSYQSMGILLAAAIAEKITRQPIRTFLQKEIFSPLKMTNTALGLGKHKLKDTVPSQVEFADPPGGTPETAKWDWNSPWWRDFGAPWGGAHSTAADIAKFLNAFAHPKGTPLKPETARRMTANQNQTRPYGIGWAITPGGFGHGGSTGTLCWADTSKDARFVLLTSLPAKVSQKTIIDPVDKAVRAAL